MKFNRRSILLGSLGLTIFTSSASAANQTYVNARFGTSISYPAGVFSNANPAPENGDGQSWKSNDGAELSVWGQSNAAAETPKSLLNSVSSDIPKVTYKRVGKHSMTVSGFNGETIIYHRAQFGKAGGIHSVELRYPAMLAKTYNPIAAAIANSLTGP